MKNLSPHSQKPLFSFSFLITFFFSFNSMAEILTEETACECPTVKIVEGKNLVLQNLPNSKEPFTISYEVEVYSAFLTPGKKHLVVNFHDVFSYLYPLDNLRPRYSPLEIITTTGLEQTSFSEDDRYVSIVNGNEISIYDLERNVCVRKEKKNQVIAEAKFEGKETLFISFEEGKKEKMTISLRNLLTLRQ